LNEHKTGVRKLTYSACHGGNFVSIGHENYMNVWSIEASIQRAFQGKLEGHTSSVIAAEFTNLSPYLASLDEKMNLRFWDVRNLKCLQLIQNEK
jgi:WD40 repeat protein